jgi:hypothetical protein
MKANGALQLINLLHINMIIVVSATKAWKKIIGLLCIIFLLHEIKLVNYDQCWAGMKK